MKNNDYWKKRFELLENTVNQKGVRLCRYTEMQYFEAQKSIENKIRVWYQRLADNNQISMAEARRLLSAKELSEFKWDVGEYIKYGEENVLNGKWMKELENASARHHISRLEALNLQTQQSMEVLFGNQLDGVDTLMRNIYSEGYYHTAFEIQKGFGVGWGVASVDQQRLEKIILKPWAADGKNFSDRIWQNKSKLTNELHTELTQMCMLGKAPDQAIKNIARKMGTSKVNAGRLVMTESAYFASASQKDAFNELDMEQFEIVATLDSHTSAICQEMDGKVYAMNDYESGVTAPPFHVWCRSTTVPYFDDEWSLGELAVGKRAARSKDGKTYLVPDSMTYPEWKKSMVDGDTDGLQEADASDIIKKMPFVPATSISEANEYAKSFLGISNVSYKGVDIVTANAWNQGLQDAFERFPELKKKFGFVGEAHERNIVLKPVAKQYYWDELIKRNPTFTQEQLEPYIDKSVAKFMEKMSISKDTFAQSWSPTGIFAQFKGVTVNRDWGKDHISFVSELTKNVSTQFHPIGCDTIRSVLDHEIGHQLDDLLDIGNISEIQQLFDSRTHDAITFGLSKYSWDNMNTNRYSEMIAEAWSEYCNNPAPREMAKVVGNTIIEAYQIKFNMQ